MGAMLQPIVEPDSAAMTAHLEHLFGGFLHGFHDGLIELAWTDTSPDASGRYRLAHAELFGTDRLDDLVARAVELNRQPMCNTYIGAALRRPDTAPFGRCKDEDFLALTAAYVDIDDAEAAQKARDRYAAAKPTQIVITGSDPYVRVQCWWLLEEPIDDPARHVSLIRGLTHALGGDVVVTNPSRVMRLAGSLAWPHKAGRKLELTRIHPLATPGQPVYMAEHLERVFPPVAPMLDVSPGTVDLSGVTRAAGPLGLPGKIADGREQYMRDTTLACLIQYVGENGASPSVQELFDLVWPQYERNVDLSRPGRGPEEVAEKCRAAIRRFEEGKIKNVETPEKAVALFERKKAARSAYASTPVSKPSGSFWTFGETEPPAPPTLIKTVDFLTLMTEEVEEEPDYIEPNFAGPGSFVLIAGPPKAQKSFLLQELLVTSATSGPFLAKTFTVPRPLRVFWLQAEMSRKMLRQRAQIMRSLALTGEQKGLLSQNLIVSERFYMILDDDGVRTTVATIKAAFPVEPPDIIAIDPMANLFDGDSENDNAQIMRFLKLRLEAVRQAINPQACIILVHHATKRTTEEMARDPFVAIRGASALRGYYDSAIIIWRENEEGKLRKVHFEMRSGEEPEAMSVEFVAGRFQKTGGLSGITKDACREMLAALDEAWKSGRPWSPYARAAPEGRYAIKNLSQRFGISAKSAKSLIDAWIENGVITYRDRDRWKHPAGLEVTGNLD